MRKQNIPVTFNGEVVGRATSDGGGNLDVKILYQPLIDIINKDAFRDLEIGYSVAVEKPN